MGRSNNKRPLGAQSRTPPDENKSKKYKQPLDDDAVKSRNKFQKAKAGIRTLKEMARDSSQDIETVKKAAEEEVSAELTLQENSDVLKRGNYGPLVGQDDEDVICVLAKEIEIEIEELAKERKTMLKDIRDLKKDMDEIKAAEQERKEKFALRDIYHAFNEKCLRMMAKKMDMSTHGFFKSYPIRNIGDVSEDAQYSMQQQIRDGRYEGNGSQLRKAWSSVKEAYKFPYNGPELWDLMHKVKNPFDKYVHGGSYDKVNDEKLLEIAEKHINDKGDLDLFTNIVKWSTKMTSELGHDTIYDYE